MASSMAVLAVQAPSASAAPGDGTLTVRVIRDVAGNGTDDAATDFGINGVPLTVADASGHTVNAQTDTSGVATIDLSTLVGGRYRVQANPPAGSGLQASPTRTGAGALQSLDSYVTVANGANATVTMGMWDPTEYCQSNPDLVTCGIAGTTNAGANATGKTGVVTFNSVLPNAKTANPPTVAQTQLSQSQQQGSVFGLGTDRSGNIFLGTSVKRHSAYGPAGAVNAIYRVNTGSANSVSTFVTLPGTLPAHAANLLHDDAIAPFVGNAGLGGVTVSGDGKTLYAVNLNDKKLYSVAITGTGNGVSAGAVNSATIPAPAGCEGVWHPYGLGHRGMTIYVGGTCGAEDTVSTGTPFGDPTNMAAYVYQVGGTVAGGNASFNPVWQHNLNYGRGCSYYSTNQAGGCRPGTATAAVGQPGSAHWEAWNDRSPAPFIFNFVSAPQPILSSIAVTANGSLVVGMKDRFADMQGNGTYRIGAADGSQVVTAINAGDVLRACNVNGTLVTENNATCGGTTGALAGNNQGPGGGEYYNDDWTDGPGFHNQTSEGGVTTYAATTDVWSTRIDPFDGSVFKQGVGQFGIDGSKSGGQEVFASDPNDSTGFGKGAGLASLQTLCTSAPVQLGNRVWFDANRNGVEDPDELPVPGVTVKLLAATGNTPLASTTTSADGQYYFGAADGVQPNTQYRIQFDYSTATLTSLPNITSAAQLAFTQAKANGVDNRIDSDPSPTTGTLAVATVTTGSSGTVNHDIDAGLIVNNTIGDFVYYDRNRNGIQDANDPGVAGIRVRLLDGQGNEVQSTTTDANGKYQFTNVPDGTYSVKFDLEPQNLAGGPYDGFVVSPPNVGTNRAIDSNPDPTTYTASVTVGATTTRDDETIDAGIQAPGGVIGNFVWKDTNGNGVQDAGEPGIPGVKVELLDAAGNVVDTTTTVNDARGEGFYLFSGLSVDDGSGSATYRVRFDLAANQLPADINDYTVSPYQAAAGTAATDSDANPADNYTSPNVVLTPSARANITIDAGLVPPADSIGDFVWADLNKNGLQDANEPGIAGVTVRLYNAATDQVVGTTTTDSSGRYNFTNLADGSYYVIVDRSTLPAAYADNVFTTQSAAGTGQNDSEVNSNGRSNTVTIGANARAYDNLDAGLVAPANTIGDFVWNDLNRNGVQDAGEPGIQNVTVKLLDDTGKPVLNAAGNPITTTTDANGNYQFTNIPDGSYQIQVDLTTLPADARDFVATVPNTPPDNSKDSDIGPNGISAVVTVGVNNRTNNTIDAGLAAPRGTIGNYVFYDQDRNNVQSAGDTGVPNVKVSLLDGNGDPVDGNGDGTPDTTTTDGDGFYQFTNLAPGTYRVGFGVGSALPAVIADWTVVTPKVGSDDTVDSDANQTTGITGPVTIGVGSRTDNNLDMGLVPPRNRLGDFVWFDRNRNGVQDANEPGIDGVTVQLVNLAGSVVDTTTTANGGAYEFPDILPDGKYAIRIDLATLPAPYTDFVPTTANAGTDDALDSDISTTTATSQYVSLGVGNRSNQTLDAGLIAPFNNIGDFVWNDLNGNGIQDANEPGLEGVTVQLLDQAGNLVKTTTTDANGMYMFADLEDGTYSVRVPLGSLPAGIADYRPTLQNQGGSRALDSDADATGLTQPVTVGAGARQNLTIDVGLVAPPNTIGDRVWYDRNRNGVQDSGEPGLQGVTVDLLDANGRPVPDANGNPITTVTDANGAYQFTNLPNGTYEVRFRTDNLPAGIVDYTLTKQGAGTDDTVDSDANQTTGITRTVTLGVGSRSFPDLDAGLVSPTNSIGDFVWKDVNRNGIQDANEPGVPGVAVALLDANGNVVATTSTGADGKYSFSGLDDGVYSVRFGVTPDTLPTAYRDYTVTTQNAGNDDAVDSDADPTTGQTQQVTLGTGARSDTTLDMGLVQPENVIAGSVWNDQNRDGIQDPSEPVVSGATVELINSNGTVVATTTTDVAGGYRFPDVPDGTYTVRFPTDNLPAGVGDYTLTTQNAPGSDPTNNSDPSPTTGVTAPITVGTGTRTPPATSAGLIAPVNTQTGEVWFDRNRDGVRDATESGLGGITVQLVDSNGTVVLTTTTKADGTYSFSGFPDGTYTVQFPSPALPAPNGDYTLTQQGAGTDRTKDSDAIVATGSTAPITFGVGQRTNASDAGYLAPVNVIGDFVWIDQNANGIQDANEPGVEGVKVDLLKAGAVVASTTTNNLGRYTFADLDDGTYAVRFDVADLPAAVRDYTVTTANVGNDDTVDSDANSTGVTPDVTVGVGARSNLTLDLGLVKPVNTQSGFVWKDTNRNGLQDTGEPGLQGVTVQLVDGNGAVVATTTTNANGQYTFTGFPDGAYTVKVPTTGVPAPNGDYTLTPQGDGTNPTKDSDPSATTGSTAPITFGVGSRTNDSDAGYQAPQNVLGDFVWIDRNGNGIQDAGEPGVQGVKVALVTSAGQPVNDANGNPITTTTDAAGKYSFTDLPDGTYAVRFDVADLPAAVADYGVTLANQGTDDAVDSDANATGLTPAVTLGVNERSNLTLDLGLVQPVNSIGDFVWADLNHDGLQSANEPGIQGVTVRLLDANGQPVDDANGKAITTTTDANGKYEFAGLADGTYRVGIDLSTLTGKYASWVPTIQGAGSNVAIDSDANRSTGITGPVTVGVNQRSNQTLDAGFVPSNTVSGTVYRDTNNNGKQDPKEPGVPCATVQLLDATGAVVATTRTNNDGVYQFVNVPDGTYSVRVDTSTGCGLPNGSTIGGTPGKTTETLPPVTVGPNNPAATTPSVPVVSPRTTPPTSTPPSTGGSGAGGSHGTNGGGNPGTTNGNGGTTASTGVDIAMMLGLALLLLAGGLGIVVAGRRRRGERA